MSLYEPSVRSSTWSLASRSARRPLTTLEGWKELGAGVFTMKSSVRTLASRQSLRAKNSNREEGRHTLEPEFDIPAVPAVPKAFFIGRPERLAPKIAAANEKPDSNGLRIEIWDEQHPETREDIEEQQDVVYSSREKWSILSMITLAAMLPNLTNFMYLPALNNISESLDVSLAAVTPTITTYLLFQGIASLVWRPVSDSFGRRVVYLVTLSTYIVASVVLAFTKIYTTLIIFRAVQSLSIIATIAMGTAIIHDIYGPSEASQLETLFLVIQFCAVLLAPILGGLLAECVGWRLIFVFLLSICGIMLVSIALFLPETQPDISSDGLASLMGIHKPLAYRIGILKAPREHVRSTFSHEPSALSMRTILEPLELFKEKDIAMSLVFGAFAFTMWMMVTVSTTGLFENIFGLNDIQLGLSFVPNGLGAVAGSMMMASILRSGFKFACSEYRINHSLPPDFTFTTADTPSDFPLEHSRLRHLFWTVPILIVSLCGYGFTLYYPEACERPGWILLPLFLQFLISFTAHATSTITQTLVVDLWYQSYHACWAANSLVQCSVAALGVGCVQLILDRTGTWCTFVILGIVIMVLIFLPIIQWYRGVEWRAEREARREIIERLTKV